MKKVSKKKGFTLAELLVVLAILAVLVAVAIPIFTGAIGSAQKTARDANVRAIRAAAVTEILTDSTLSTKTGPWTATAEITESGEMKDLNVTDGFSGSEDIVTPTSGVAGTYTIKVTSVN